MVDLGQLSPEIPDHFDYEIPHDDSEEARYDGAIYGVDVLGVFSPLRWFTVQGSIGLYARDVTFLDRSKATDLYYASPKGTTLTDLTATAGGGLHFNFPFGLLIGANYNTVRGFGMFVGYREAIEPEPVKR